MNKYVIDESTLVAIGDAVREKDGTTEGIKVNELANRILAIPAGGGGGYDIPDEAFSFSGDCQYTVSGSTWNWFIESYGDKITTSNITSTKNMFYSNKGLDSIPFDINISPTCKDMAQMFYQSELRTVPLIKGKLTAPTGTYSGILNIGDMFAYCRYLREIPHDYFWNFGDEAFWAASENYNGDRGGVFSDCNSLRKLPDISMFKTADSQYNALYNNLGQRCYTLDEVINIPVITKKAYTSNAFSYFCNYASRVKNITFETNADGSPIVVQWKNQTIDLTTKVGYLINDSYVTEYNSGLTTATRITDDVTYAELKDNEDSWTCNIGYSRYNHDSAVATINSLPDSSAYGTNTIKFEGAAGALTDGGAINTLTEAEIAIAAAKGWTVTLV